jgi:hypothetical protein
MNISTPIAASFFLCWAASSGFDGAPALSVIIYLAVSIGWIIALVRHWIKANKEGAIQGVE